jgi:hypothetical protein
MATNTTLTASIQLVTPLTEQTAQNPRRHRCTVFIQQGAKKRRAHAIEAARKLLRDAGIQVVKLVI